jgi:hypothetical protein
MQLPFLEIFRAEHRPEIRLPNEGILQRIAENLGIWSRCTPNPSSREQ